jgi:hypothetical protein
MSLGFQRSPAMSSGVIENLARPDHDAYHNQKQNDHASYEFDNDSVTVIHRGSNTSSMSPTAGRLCPMGRTTSTDRTWAAA